MNSSADPNRSLPPAAAPGPAASPLSSDHDRPALGTAPRPFVSAARDRSEPYRQAAAALFSRSPEGAFLGDFRALQRVLPDGHPDKLPSQDGIPDGPPSTEPSAGARAAPATRTPDARRVGRQRTRTCAYGPKERIDLTAADGYRLTGHLYAPAGPTRAHLVLAGATGVAQRFYRRFARFAASHGYATLTFDYRGIGLSKPPELRGFQVDYLDWGRLDLAAAVAAMSRPDRPLYVVGHSYGGHAFGMLPNHHLVAGFYAFGTGAGWHGWMPPLERLKVLAMWHLLGPALTLWKGYLSWSAVGLGEDLPLGFYRQWKRRCRYPNYFFGDPSMRHRLVGFDQIRAPLMAANSIDDRWSPPRSRDAFIAGYRNAARETLDVEPGRVGLSAIGHMGYFKPNARVLWESALAWLDTCQPVR